jgi:hypothetical protein
MVRGLRNMQPDEGLRIYDSAAYMAAALDENGGPSRLTTVDHVRSNSPEELLSRLEPAVAGRIDFVRIPDSSYTWWLRERLVERTDADGRTEPFYDLLQDISCRFASVPQLLKRDGDSDRCSRARPAAFARQRRSSA